MIKWPIKYKDYNDVERNEDFFFDLSEAEVMEMELGTVGGLSVMISKVVASQDTPTIMKIFKDLVFKAYGEKSADGRRFIKSEELSIAFSQTPAYSILFMELATNAEAAARFVNGIIPVDEDTMKKAKTEAGLTAV